MKVLLPSHGILGQKSVNMRIPTFADIHEMQSYNPDGFLRKYHFVEVVTDADFNKVTAMDVDYLFTIGVFSLMYNAIKYEPKCPKCGSKVTTFVKLPEQEVTELHLTKKDIPYHKRIKFKEYKFTLISARQMMDAYDYGQFAPAGEETHAFEDAQVAFIMGKTLDDIEDYVKKLPVSIYLAAFLFQKLNYHGLDFVANARCKNIVGEDQHMCGHEFKFKFKISEEKVFDFDIDKMMDSFASVSEKLSFSDFMSMSIIDFNAFVTALNRQLS